MTSSIQTNLIALQTVRLIDEASRAANRTMYAVSSGLRVARAQDDAAAMAISTNLKGQIQAMTYCLVNITSADALLQTADSALQSISDLLIRMRELGTQAMSQQYSLGNLSDLDTEFQALVSEINRLALSTNYNNISLLDGTFTNMNIQVLSGVSTNDGISISIPNCKNGPQGLTTGNGILTGVTITSTVDAATALINATTAIGQINNAEQYICTARANIGAAQSRFSFALSSAAATRENLVQSNSALVDLNIAEGMATLGVEMIRQSAGYQMLNRANQAPQDILTILRG